MRKDASAFKRRGRLYLNSDFRTRDGVFFPAPPYLSLALEESPEKQAEAIRKVLSSSRVVRSVPKEEEPDPFLQNFGVKSWASFVRGALYVKILREGTSIHLIPFRNVGARRGFEEMDKKQIKLEKPSDEELVKGLERAFRKCEP